MGTIFSLAHLTVLDLPPTEVVRVAARTGYQYVGLRLIAVTETTPGYPLMDDPSMMRGTKSALADTGVGVLDIEFVKITPEIDVTGLERFVATGAELGAKYVITAPYDPDLARLADRLGAISDLSVRYGLRAVLEFFPWTVVPDLGTAVQVMEAAGRAETGTQAATLSSASGSGSEGWKARSGKFLAKWTICSPKPLAISRMTPVIGSTSRRTSRMKSRLRTAAGAYWRSSLIFLKHF